MGEDMPRSKYETAVKQCEACAADKGLKGCYECKNNIWGAKPCALSYELATQDIQNMESRLTEIRRHYEAVQYLGVTFKLQREKDIEADLKKQYGYNMTLAEFTKNAEVFLRNLKERVATRESDSERGL